MDKNLIELVNPDFSILYKGKQYDVRKANIKQSVLYQEYAVTEQVLGKPGAEQKIAAYCTYLLLRDKIEGLTFDDVLENTPADINVLELLTHLGFMNPEKLEMVKRLQETTVKRLIGRESSLSSPTAPGGPPTKSEPSPSAS